jgi:SOS-response transcriptional repressor LexA
MRTRHLGYRQKQVVEYVERSVDRDGEAPSYRMIRDELGMHSPSDVSKVVKGLERRGFLRRVGSGRVRRIKLA